MRWTGCDPPVPCVVARTDVAGAGVAPVTGGTWPFWAATSAAAVRV